MSYRAFICVLSMYFGFLSTIVFIIAGITVINEYRPEYLFITCVSFLISIVSLYLFKKYLV